jgi:hypothetical protein
MDMPGTCCVPSGGRKQLLIFRSCLLTLFKRLQMFYVCIARQASASRFLF